MYACNARFSRWNYSCKTNICFCISILEENCFYEYLKKDLLPRGKRGFLKVFHKHLENICRITNISKIVLHIVYKKKEKAINGFIFGIYLLKENL